MTLVCSHLFASRLGCIFWLLFCLIGVLLVTPQPVGAQGCPVGSIVYVDANASGANTGTSWADAYSDLQAALTSIQSGEIWVAAGTYRPTTGLDRTASFALKNCVALYGGFAGNETSREQRDWAANVTVLSSDLSPTSLTDNSDHIVTSHATNASAIIDGFTLTGGNLTDCNQVDCGRRRDGAGLYNDGGSPMLANLNLVENQSNGARGGGMYSSGGSPWLTNIVFDNNTTEGGLGGGMYIESGSPTLTNVSFVKNYAPAGGMGGGMHIESGSPTLTHIDFSKNSASSGGGLFINGGAVTLTDASFTDNGAHTNGGGLHNRGDLLLTFATFEGNSVEGGAGLYNVGNLVLSNATFAHNYAYEGRGGGLENYSSALLTNVTFSDNEAYTAGGGMYSANVYSANDSTLNNVTFANNRTDGSGGGLYNSFGTLQLANSILTNNSTSGVAPDCGGTITSLGYNLIGDATDCILTGDSTGNLIGVDAMLGPLDFNGMTMQTHALLSGSPAIDAGNPAAPGSSDYACVVTDQRGLARPQDGDDDGSARCDIGAYEFCSRDTCPGSLPPPSPVSPLRLSLFTSEVITGSVTLHWETEAEADNLGFNLYRMADDGDSATKVNAELIPAQGDAETGAIYQFVDRPGSGHYTYLIKNVDQQGVEHLRGQVEVEAEGYIFFLPALSAR